MMVYSQNVLLNNNNRFIVLMCKGNTSHPNEKASYYLSKVGCNQGATATKNRY